MTQMPIPPTEDTPTCSTLWSCQTTPEKRPSRTRRAIRLVGAHCSIAQP
jgi:hypothetical protein